MSTQRRFNKSQVCRIRHSVNILNESASSIAQHYSVSPSSIRRIASGQSYSDIPTARPVPGFPSYLAYPDNRIWSTSHNKFLKGVDKGNGQYYNLRNGQNRQAIPRSSVQQRIFA